MKTNGLICARTRHAILVPALLTTISAFSQISFTSTGNNLFAQRRNDAASGFEILQAEVILGVRQRHSTSSSFFPLPAGGNMSGGGNTSIAPKKEIPAGAPVVNTNHEPRKMIRNIRFRSTSFTYPTDSRYDIGVAKFPEEQLLLYAKSLKEYAKKNGYDTTYAFLGNMGMLSDKKRFYVVNLVTMKVEQSGLVSHGRGQGKSVFAKQYSNEQDSRCTALGRYKIGRRYKGSYGFAYRMAGLDSSNKNAYERSIVLHAMNCIPDIENIMPACVSEGCPSVSTKFLGTLSKIIDSRKRPVLMWLFDSNLQEVVWDETPVSETIVEERPSYAKNN
jgi:hypothetical protein